MALARDVRTGTARGALLVRARLHEGLRADSPEVRSALDQWPGSSWLHEDEDGLDLVLLREAGGAPTRWWLHVLLFAATLVTCLAAGALMAGVDPFDARPLYVGPVALPVPRGFHAELLLRGAPFALPCLAVLLAHEMGHYLVARRHGVPVSPPYFLPVPPYLSLIGTLGAFIRIRGPMVRRDVLLDVGVAGPVASFVLSVPLFAWGLRHSLPGPGWGNPWTPFLVRFAGEPVWLGTGPLTRVMADLLAPGSPHAPLLLHPVALAGWLGFFVTALNMLPLGQLDGGHVAYALFGERQGRLGVPVLLALLALGWLWWGWWVWALLAWGVNRGRMKHPPVLQDPPAPGRWRRRIGWAAIIVFFLTFVPVPLAL